MTRKLLGDVLTRYTQAERKHTDTSWPLSLRVLLFVFRRERTPHRAGVPCRHCLLLTVLFSPILRFYGPDREGSDPAPVRRLLTPGSTPNSKARRRSFNWPDSALSKHVPSPRRCQPDNASTTQMRTEVEDPHVKQDIILTVKDVDASENDADNESLPLLV